MEEEKDTFLKRMKRGFGVLREKLSKGYNKVSNSDYVQGVKEEQEKANPMEFYPKEFIEKETNDESDPFSTDFSKLGKTNL